MYVLNRLLLRHKYVYAVKHYFIEKASVRLITCQQTHYNIMLRIARVFQASRCVIFSSVIDSIKTQDYIWYYRRWLMTNKCDLNIYIYIWIYVIRRDAVHQNFSFDIWQYILLSCLMCIINRQSTQIKFIIYANAFRL